MGNLGKEFLEQTISNLRSLQKAFLENTRQKLPEGLLTDYFRKLHTIKGTSQIFDFKELASLAHEIETLLENIRLRKIAENQANNSLLQESVFVLIAIAEARLNGHQTVENKDFVARLRASCPELRETQFVDSSNYPIPKNLFEKLSGQEISKLSAAAIAGNTLVLLALDFKEVNFYEEFREKKSALDAQGEVIAILPAIVKEPGTTSLHFLFAFSSFPKNPKKFLDSITSEILFECSVSPVDASGLQEIVAQMIEQAKRRLYELEKRAVFDVYFGGTNVPEEHVLLIAESLAHLLNNAVDHGVESPKDRLLLDKNETGRISLRLSKHEEELEILFEDDGIGVDIDAVKSIAEEKGFISRGSKTSQNLSDVLFIDGFSTCSFATETSGRGVGLAAVKALIEDAGGTIRIESIYRKGTKLRMILPLK